VIAELTDLKQTMREGIDRVAGHVNHPRDMRVGVELKFPVVQLDGAAATRGQLAAMFQHLVDVGWSAQREGDRLTGATRPGEMNDTVASCETGYCKAEFSLAHTGDLHAMAKQVDELRATLQPFCEAAGVALIGCGIHPVTPPSRRLKMNASRAGVWGRVFRSNHCIGADDGDDVDLFTVNAANHVHVGVPSDAAARFVNAVNGYAPALIALGANAKVWRGAVDDDHHSVAEAFWDWWQPVRGRVGMPAAAFDDLGDYVDGVAALPCLYVKRADGPIALRERIALGDYLARDASPGIDMAGREVTVTPEPADVALHNSCYWYNARVSRYFTVENRVFDQQPPEALLAPAAMTLGLAAAADEADEALRGRPWHALREARETAYRTGFANGHGIDPAELADEAIDLAVLGLERRGFGEQQYLEPFVQRLKTRRNPAVEAAELFAADGPAALVNARRWA